MYYVTYFCRIHFHFPVVSPRSPGGIFLSYTFSLPSGIPRGIFLSYTFFTSQWYPPGHPGGYFCRIHFHFPVVSPGGYFCRIHFSLPSGIPPVTRGIFLSYTFFTSQWYPPGHPGGYFWFHYYFTLTWPALDRGPGSGKWCPHSLLGRVAFWSALRGTVGHTAAYEWAN